MPNWFVTLAKVAFIRSSMAYIASFVVLGNSPAIKDGGIEGWVPAFKYNGVNPVLTDIASFIVNSTNGNWCIHIWGVRSA